MTRKEEKVTNVFTIAEKIDCDNAIAEIEEWLYSIFKKEWKELKSLLNANADYIDFLEKLTFSEIKRLYKKINWEDSWDDFIFDQHALYLEKEKVRKRKEKIVKYFRVPYIYYVGLWVSFTFGLSLYIYFF